MTVRTHPAKSRYEIAHAIPLPRVLRAKDSAAAPEISMQKQYRKKYRKTVTETKTNRDNHKGLFTV